MTYLRLPKPFDREEVERLRDACDDPMLWAACSLYRETGMRISEGLSIRREQAEPWLGGPTYIFRSKQERWSFKVVGKGSKERLVVLTDQAIEDARVLLTMKKQPAPTIDRRAFLIPWAERRLRGLMKELGRKVGVDCHPHRWRHSFVQELVDSGAPIQVVADMAGHSDISTTRLYFESSPVAKADALEGRRKYLRKR